MPVPLEPYLFHHLQDALPAEAPEFLQFASRRSVVYAGPGKGMIACSQPLAAEAGLEILRAGGNAADAAIAVSAMLNVTEPAMCGIGGDAFCLYFNGKTKEVKALNGSGRAPAALTLDKVRASGVVGSEIPYTNLNSVTVPGCAAAWVDTHETLGSGKLTLEDILGPAIRAAEAGVPISELTSSQWREVFDCFIAASDNAHEMLIADPATGKLHAPAPGEVKKNPELAQTFRAVAKDGKKGFYEGRIAEAIVELIQSKGGHMTLEDLASHTTTPVTPITANYGGPDGVLLHEIGPNTQGIVAVIALGIIEVLQEDGIVDLRKAKHNDVEWLHTLIEAIRLGFADARAFVGDPEHVKVPVEELLSKEYLRKRAALFDPKAAIPNFAAGAPIASSDTVLFVTADGEGNACSYIQSNYAGFGTYAVPKGCGFTLQNRGSNFELEEGHPNCIAGGKRPYHTIIPALVTKGDKLGGDLLMTYGVMGGFNQPQGHVQVLLNMLHHGFTAQSALDAPRFCISAEKNSDGEIGTDVFLEDGISQEVQDKLTEMGHNIKLVKGRARGVFGRGQIIQRLPNGVWAGGSDPRADGHAVPQL
ncbi:gamma-glutamyltranspeptidase [Pseudohyphozyma bogoriensis]|nr:gamma-glutamyltranspeptidase [Pseudohyphozyma bogoriensis]